MFFMCKSNVLYAYMRFSGLSFCLFSVSVSMDTLSHYNIKHKCSILCVHVCGEALAVEFLGSVENPIIAITPKSTFTWRGSNY